MATNVTGRSDCSRCGARLVDVGRSVSMYEEHETDDCLRYLGEKVWHLLREVEKLKNALPSHDL
jgi:hypothetical protein